MATLHHLRLNVADLTRTRSFYEPMLSWLGFHDMGVHVGANGKVERLRFSKDGFILLFSQASQESSHDQARIGLHHLAFAVSSREEVDRFYNEVLVHLPAVRIENPPVDCPEYRPGYYATFFYDPDEIKLEVTYTPQ